MKKTATTQKSFRGLFCFYVMADLDRDALIKIKIDDSGALKTLANLAKRLSTVFSSENISGLSKIESGLSRINSLAQDLSANLKNVKDSLSNIKIPQLTPRASTPKQTAPTADPRTVPTLQIDNSFAQRLGAIRNALQAQYDALQKNRAALGELQYAKLIRDLTSVGVQLNNVESAFNKTGQATVGMEGKLNNLSARLNVFDKSLSHTTNNVEDFSSRTSRMSANLFFIADGLKNLGQGLTNAIARPLIEAGKRAIVAGGDFQSLIETLTSAVGSAERAGQVFDELYQIAKLPGIGLKESVSIYTALTNTTNLTSDAIENLIRLFGKLNSISPNATPENLEASFLQINQALSKNKFEQTDLKILLERLPALGKVLKEVYGDLAVTAEGLREKGLTPEKVFADPKFLAALEKIPQLTGGIKNSLTNLSDSITLSFAKIGLKIAPLLQPLVDYLVEKLPPAVDNLISLFDKLPKPLQIAAVAFAGLTAAIGPLLTTLGILTGALSSLIGLFGGEGL